jgi:hypothetical protein
MAFNLQAFGAGFAKKVTEDLDTERDRITKLADDETMVATRQRLAKQAKRDEEQEIADNLVESLSLYFTPEQIEDIVPRGKIAVAHAVSKGKFYDEKGMSASSMYTMPDNDIANMNTSTTTNIGDVSKTADVPEGMGSDSFASRFTPIKPTKEFNTIAAFQVSLLQERIDAGDDPEKIAIINEKEEQFFAQASKLENAKRKPEDKNPVNFYTNTDRFKLINGMRELARNNKELTVGAGGILMGEYRGSNRLSLAELDASLNLFTQNNLVGQEEILYNEIKSITGNALNSLDSYAKANYKKIKADKVFENKDQLKEQVELGNIGVGDTYIVKIKVNDGEMYATGTYLGENYKKIGIDSGYRIASWLPTYEPAATRP